MSQSKPGRLPLGFHCARRRPGHLGWAGACHRTVCSRDRNRRDQGPAGCSGPWVAVVLWTLVTCLQLAPGKVFAGGDDRSIRHRLLEGSVLVDACPPCGRPIIPLRLRGTLDVTATVLESGVQQLGLRNIAWHASAADGATIGISGTGHLTMQPGGIQDVVLDLVLAMGGTNLSRRFTNRAAAVSRPLPNLAADLESQERTPVQVFGLSLRSAPLRDLWFVTSHGFTTGKDGTLGRGRRVAGDVLSMEGHVVAGNGRLTGQLGIMPIVPPLALGALDVQPGGRIMFALRERVFSETLGHLSPGVVLGSDGSVFARVRDLLDRFRPIAWPASEPGVDAVQVLDSGEVLFSTTADVLASSGTLGHGDVLSSDGTVRWRFKEILGAFVPSPWVGTTLEEVGVDAWHAWPHGEAWFSVRKGFHSAVAGSVYPGDVLSTGGWVVYRNLELLEGFEPLEDLADFGLEGLFVLTDLAAAPAAGSVRGSPVEHGILVEGIGRARAWQLEWSPDPGGTFAGVGSPTPWARWIRPTDGQAGFFRVRSW